MSTSMQKLGARLKQLREEARLRVEDVSRLAGVNRSHIYSIERGTWRAGGDLIEKLANIYRVDLSDCYVVPDKHVRNRFRELVRLVPNAKLSLIIEAAEQILGKTLDQMIQEAAPSPQSITDEHAVTHSTKAGKASIR